MAIKAEEVTVSSLIQKAFGSTYKAGPALGVVQVSVWRWARLNYFPATRKESILQALRLRGVTNVPDTLFQDHLRTRSLGTLVRRLGGVQASAIMLGIKLEDLVHCLDTNTMPVTHTDVFTALARIHGITLTGATFQELPQPVAKKARMLPKRARKAAASEAPVPAKRKPGRPRKNPLVEEAPVVAKRRPGRPRKNPLPAEVVVEHSKRVRLRCSCPSMKLSRRLHYATVAEFVDGNGGPYMVAATLQVTPKQVQHWADKGYIPTMYRERVLLYAQQSNLLLRKNCFVPPRLETKLAQAIYMLGGEQTVADTVGVDRKYVWKWKNELAGIPVEYKSPLRSLAAKRQVTLHDSLFTPYTCSAAEVIRRAGGYDKVTRKFRLSDNTVAYWIRENRVPAKYHDQLQAMFK